MQTFGSVTLGYWDAYTGVGVLVSEFALTVEFLLNCRQILQEALLII